MVALPSEEKVRYNNLAAHFGSKMGETYQVVFGENPNAGMSGQMWSLYFLITLLVNIICLNLLIAILSNTYDNVQASQDSTNCKKKAEIIQSLSNQMFWKSDEVKLVYIHVLNYAGEGLTSNSDVDEWVGRVRIMVDKIDGMKLEQRNIKDELKTEQQAAKEELKAKLNEQNEKMKQLRKE